MTVKTTSCKLIFMKLLPGTIRQCLLEVDYFTVFIEEETYLIRSYQPPIYHDSLTGDIGVGR